MASNEITATAIEHEADAVGQFEHLLGRLTHEETHRVTHGKLESMVQKERGELLRRLIQGHLGHRGAQEPIRERVVGEDLAQSTCSRKTEHITHVQLDLIEGRNPGFSRIFDRCDDTVAVAVQLVGDQGGLFGPDQPVKRHSVTLKQQRQLDPVLAFVAPRDDLADPIRGEVNDTSWRLGHALLAPAGDVVTRALVRLVGNADLGGDPPAAWPGATGKGTQLGTGVALDNPVLEPRHRPPNDLAID